MSDFNRVRIPVLGVRIDLLSWSQVLALISKWGVERRSAYICISNVHSVISAIREPQFYKVLDEADLVTADGAPVAWMMRRQKGVNQERISGPDLFLKYCAIAEKTGESIYLYGSTELVLNGLVKSIKKMFPDVKIAGYLSPPFRRLSDVETEEIVRTINESGASTVWVGLGCPKQEYWMASQRNKISAVMIGVGAAFDFHAGLVSRAPNWMQACYLEWFYRLMQDPRRLWRRYLLTNSLFIYFSFKQIFGKIFNRN